MLKPHQDAYGQMMLDYLDHGGGYEVTEHEDGYVGIGAGPRLYFSEYDTWRQVERDALELAQGRVLDVGCGAGRFMLWLRDRGHDVAGIDTSPGAIEVCRRRGLADVHVMSIGQVSRKRLGTFDTVLLLGGNLALLGPEPTAKRNLARLARVTSPGGKLFGGNRDWSKSSDERTRAKAAENIGAGRFSGEHRVRIRYRTFATPYYTSSRMSVDELRRLIEGTGWTLDDVLDRDEGIYIAVLLKR
jgi:SAM-dependent methyltransferase